MVCAYGAVVCERPAYLNGVVLARHGRVIVVGTEFVSARDAGDLFCVLSVVCQRRAGFFRLSIGRHAAGSGFYRAFLCAARIAPRVGPYGPPNAREPFPP